MPKRYPEEFRRDAIAVAREQEALYAVRNQAGSNDGELGQERWCGA